MSCMYSNESYETIEIAEMGRLFHIEHPVDLLFGSLPTLRAFPLVLVLSAAGFQSSDCPGISNHRNTWQERGSARCLL